MRKRIYELLAATAQAMGQQPTVEAIRLMTDDLEGYTEEQIATSLRALRRRGGRFCLSAILDNIVSADGRPSPDRAWAMFPKEEADSAVVTEEMAEAWSVASELFCAGDVVGAQIAFKREYTAIIERARENGDPVKWFPSLGHEPSRRADALIEAAVNRRLPVEHAAELLAHDSDTQQLLYQKVNQAGLLTSDQAQKYLSGPPNVEAGKKVLDMVRTALKSV